MPSGNPVWQPTEVPEWADDGTSLVAPVQTLSAVVEPNQGKKHAGFGPGEKPAAQHLNWFMFYVYWWLLWLQDLPNLNFTSAGAQPIGPWTNNHVFNGNGGLPWERDAELACRTAHFRRLRRDGGDGFMEIEVGAAGGSRRDDEARNPEPHRDPADECCAGPRRALRLPVEGHG